ncbi:MAG TPA: dissimilatory-type sulfite reductase subunit alpha [bacterium]
MADLKYKTPLLDELEKGEWPSFVKELKRAAAKKPMADGLLGQLEKSYRDKQTYWKHGGLVGVQGYGAGIIGRYTALADQFPEVTAFHTVRINQPAGWFYSSKALRQLCDIWDKHGSGMLNLHGSTGDFVLLGTTSEELEDTFTEYSAAGWDLGGSSSDMRTPSCCNGMARCEFACFDTMALCQDLTMTYQDELHRPAFPYKFKIKIAGCPNDCVASIARSDLSIMGTWKDDIQVDQAEMAAYAKAGKDIQGEVVGMCPTACMSWDGKAMKINNKQCNRCMHCINVLPKALRAGKVRGATILVGGKAPILEGAQLGSVVVPFMPMKAPFSEIKELIQKLWDVWGENGNNRERIGEFMLRVGVGNFMESIELAPDPQMVLHPRENPYIFYEEYFEEE